MIRTVDLLDLLKEHLGSDYKTAKALNIPQSRISEIRHKGGVLTDAQGLQAAELLDMPQEFVILSLAAERSFNSPAIGILTHLADKYDPRKIAAYVLPIVTVAAVEFGDKIANLALTV